MMGILLFSQHKDKSKDEERNWCFSKYRSAPAFAAVGIHTQKQFSEPPFVQSGLPRHLLSGARYSYRSAQ
jgi:hypothetical protein